MNRFCYGALAVFVVVFWLGIGVIAPLPLTAQADEESIARAPSTSSCSVEVDSFVLVNQSLPFNRYLATTPLWMPKLLPQGIDEFRPVRMNGPPVILS